MNHQLRDLIQPADFVGRLCHLNFESALVLTNDHWKDRCSLGANCLLLATALDPAQPPGADEEVLLLRVRGTADLPDSELLLKARIDFEQQQRAVAGAAAIAASDQLTAHQMQFHGLDCRVLGTFYERDGALWLGSDLESFRHAARLNVYRPTGAALCAVVNQVDPQLLRRAAERAQQQGLTEPLPRFRIGTVRYASTQHRRAAEPPVVVTLDPNSFLNRRTAVLGASRFGKSNAIKQLVTQLKRTTGNGPLAPAFLLFDLNGEYSNSNQQDGTSLYDEFPNQTVRYRMTDTPGFEDLRTNCYEQLVEGHAIIRRELEAAGKTNGDYLRCFLNLNLEEPDPNDHAEHARFQRTAGAYQVLLYQAGFTPPPDFKVRFVVSKVVQDAIEASAGQPLPHPAHGLTLSEAATWFMAARAANLATPLASSTAGKPWVDDTLKNLLDMLCQRSNGKGGYISGYRVLVPAARYHSPRRRAEVTTEIVAHLAARRIVILDLSVGDPVMREKLGEQVAGAVFHAAMQRFTEGQPAQPTLVFVEEAHNLLGRGLQDSVWVRLFREGSKAGLGLMLSTQQASALDPTVLRCCENFLLFFQNCSAETAELAKYFDFADYAQSLLTCQDVGYARVRTLANPFTIPVQIDPFLPGQPQ